MGAMRRECEHEWEADDDLGPFRCTTPAVGKWQGKWYCSAHLDEQMGDVKPLGKLNLDTESDAFL